MNRISNIQLFLLIISFEVGSTTLFALGIGAEQNAWIVIIIAFLIGLGLLWVYTQFPRYFPHQNFAKILDEILGKKLSKPLLLLFGLYFYSQASHNFYEFGVLINMTALPSTPLAVILLLFIFVTIYILILGFEVFARTAEILMPYFLLFLSVLYLVTLFTGEVDINSLQPILGEGIGLVLKELPTVIAFPFGEMVVFLMFFHLIQDHKLIRKTAFWGLSVSGLLLLISLLFMIAVLGPELASKSEVPFLEMVLTINIAEIITNLDSLAVFLMFIGGFYKTALHLFGFSLAITWVFNKQNPKWVIIIFGLLLPFYSLQRFPGLDYQRWLGIENGIYSILLFSFLPVLLLLIWVVKEKKKSPPVKGE
ncbi:GerAB/ArcD/ProY family transporter [Bacillus solitudinis]|uniref:GerAB/ArcD/ProY family transporter n=1 Tax=Bacillus solitudinis TaxID=2014074 RepID=UPI000C248D80|nr:GerAB/ArcD/ProY family transporter [Bacillus solitudinis]